MSQTFTLSIRKIASLDDRSPETLVATIGLDPESTVAMLRQKLCSERLTASLDAFMLPSEPKFALAKIDEDHKLWTAVLSDKDSITLLTTEKNEQDAQHKPGALRGWFDRRNNSDQETQSETMSTTAESSSGARHATTTGILKASDLTEAAWEDIVTGQSLTHAVTLGTGRASQDPGPQRAARPLVKYNHASVTRLVSDATTKDDSVFNTERNHKYAQKGWIDGTVNITTPYATASIEAVRSEAFARDLVNKTIHVTNTHIIQRAKVQFDRQLLTLSDEFQERLDSIMLINNDDEKRTKFEHLFESYGHVFPLQVVLGGTFIQSATGQVKDESEIEDKKHELRASLNAHIFGVGGGGGIGGGSSKEKGDTSKTLGFTSTIDVNGGDSTLILDPKAWMETVKDNENWRVVRIEKVIPIVDLVSPEARAEIDRVAPLAKCKALYGKWIDLRPQALPDGMCKGLRQFPAPEISGDSWFWLGQPIGQRVLIVKERIPGSLCKIKSVEPIWNSKGKWPWLGMVNYLGNPFPEQSESFEALTSCVYCQPRVDFKAPQPDLEVEPWSKLRAVRHELLVKGECDKDIWNDKGKHGPDQASLWSITHDDSTVDIDSFKAFAGREKQSIGVWKLKADEVEMVE